MRWWWRQPEPLNMPVSVVSENRRKSTPDQRDAWAAQRDFEARLQWVEAQVIVLLQRERERELG